MLFFYCIFFREAEWRKYKFIFCISAWLPEKVLYFLFGQREGGFCFLNLLCPVPGRLSQGAYTWKNIL